MVFDCMDLFLGNLETELVVAAAGYLNFNSLQNRFGKSVQAFVGSLCLFLMVPMVKCPSFLFTIYKKK